MAGGSFDLDNPVQLSRQTNCITLQTYHGRKLKMYQNKKLAAADLVSAKSWQSQ